MGGLWQDFRYAARGLGKNPGVTAIMVVTLALGIGATTAIFSVVYGVLLRPLPYPDPNRIMAVFEVTSKGRPSRLADPNFDDFRDQNRSFQAIAKYTDYVASVSGASQPTRTTVASVSPDFLEVFGVQPILGRDFSAGDAKKGAGPTVLVSYGYWRQHLGSPRDLSQSHLKIDGAVFSVIGVLPAGFRFPGRRGSVAAGRSGRREPEPDVAQLQRRRASARRRDRRAGESGHQRDRAAHSRRVERAGRLSPQGRNGRPAPGLDHGQGSLAAAGPARRGGISAAGGVRERGEPAAGAGVGARARARHSQRARRGARTADPSVPDRSASCCRWSAAASACWERSGAWRDWLRWRRRICRGWTASRSAFRSSCSRSSSPPRSPPASERSPPCARRPGTCARASWKAGADRRARRAASASAGSSWRRRSRSRWSSWSERDCFGRSLMKVLEVNPGFRVDKIVTMDVSLPWVDDPKAKAGQAVFFSRPDRPAQTESRACARSARRAACRWMAAFPTACFS